MPIMSAKDVICGTFSLKIDFYFEIGAICVSVATRQLKIWVEEFVAICENGSITEQNLLQHCIRPNWVAICIAQLLRIRAVLKERRYAK